MASSSSSSRRRLHRPRLPDSWSQRSRFSYSSFDAPPRSRLFLVLEQKVMTPEVWLRLSSFGDIEDFWPQVNKRTLEPTGAAFVKYARSSDAARALERMGSDPGTEPGLLKICLAESRVPEKSGNLNHEPHAEICAKVPKTSQATLAIEECNKNKSSSLKTPETNLSVSTGVKPPASTPEQETAVCEVQGESLNTLDKSSSLKTPVTNMTVSTEVKSPVSRPEEETAICEVQEENLNTSDKSSSLEMPIANLSVSTEVKSPVSRPEQETAIHEVQGKSLNTSDEHISLDEPMISAEKEATSCEVKGSSLIPEVCKTTSIEPVIKTSESDTHKSSVREQQRKIHRIQGSNLIVIGCINPKTKAKLSDVLTDRSFTNRAQQNTNTVRESNLITLASPSDTTLFENAARSFEGNVKRRRRDIAEPSSLITLGCNTPEVEPVTTPPELYGYGYYVGSTGSTLPASLTEPFTSSLHYYNPRSEEQQTDTQRIQENSLITLDRSLKSSECKFYMGARKTRIRKVQRSNLLASVDPPDLASVERSNSGRKASISRRLLVVSKCPFTQEQIFSLFGVVPGLECCETPPYLYNSHVFAVIRYRNIASAVYAKCRLHGLEYPLGNHLHVSFLERETHETNSSLIQEMATQVVTSQLVSVIWNNNWAPQLLASSKSQIPSPLQTDAELPSRKSKAPPDSAVREKLFIVFDPCPLPQDVLDNVLSRFGNFINSHLIPGENVAYAKFAERTSASHAIAMLHGKTVNSVKLKVILADLPTGL